MDDLLCIDPECPYTVDGAVQALKLPGTLSGDRSAFTLWNRSKAMLTLAACYPRLVAAQNEFDAGTLDMLVKIGACTDLRRACTYLMMYINPNNMLDVASEAYLTYDSQSPAPRSGMCKDLIRYTDELKELYRLCRTFYFENSNDNGERIAAARSIAAMNGTYPYTTFAMLLAIVRAMMATAHRVAPFDLLKDIFIKILGRWHGRTRRLETCAAVIVQTCGEVKAHMRVKLVASLLRELWVASIGSEDHYRNDKNLLTLIPDLSSVNVYYTHKITLVYNIKRQCVGVADYDEHSKRSNMLSYAAMQSAMGTYINDMPKTLLAKADSKSTLTSVKVNGVPSDEDDYDGEAEQYLSVGDLTPMVATKYGFAVWDKDCGELKY